MIALLGSITAAAAAAPNDDFADAAPIHEGIEVTTSNYAATIEATEDLCEDGPTSYWEFTAPADGNYFAYAHCSSIDTVIGLSSALASLVPFHCADDTAGSFDGVIPAYPMTTGESVWLQMSPFSTSDRGAGRCRCHPGMAGDRQRRLGRPGAAGVPRRRADCGPRLRGEEPDE